MNQYSLIVGNIGEVWAGANGARALQEFGDWRRIASTPGGRAGWEPVELFRNDQPYRAFTPGPFWFVELTDTFGGEANYSWVTRVKVQAKTLPHALRRFSKDAGFVGRLRKQWDDGNAIRYDVQGACVCFFISAWDEDCHGELSLVREL